MRLAAVILLPVENLGVVNDSVPVVFIAVLINTPVGEVVVPTKLWLDPSPRRSIKLLPAG